MLGKMSNQVLIMYHIRVTRVGHIVTKNEANREGGHDAHREVGHKAQRGGGHLVRREVDNVLARVMHIIAHMVHVVARVLHIVALVNNLFIDCLNN